MIQSLWDLQQQIDGVKGNCNVSMNPKEEDVFQLHSRYRGEDRTWSEERFLFLGLLSPFCLLSMSLFPFAELCAASRFLEVLALNTREESSLLLCFVYFYLFFDNFVYEYHCVFILILQDNCYCPPDFTGVSSKNKPGKTKSVLKLFGQLISRVFRGEAEC